MLIRTKNNLHEYATGQTYLSKPVSAGGTTAWVKDIGGWVSEYAMQIGEVGKSRSEVLIMNNATLGGTAVTGEPFTYDHPTDTRVYFYPYNQIIFERSTAGTAGTATPLSNGTVTIDADEEYTTFEDTTASAGYAYKTKFYNSSLTTESPESDWISFGGYSDYSLAGIRKRIKDRINANIPDDTINSWIREWQEQMNNAAMKVNQDYSMGTLSLTFTGTAQEATITANDFVRPRRCWITTNGTDWARMRSINYNEYAPDEVFVDTAPRYYFNGDNIIGRLPHDASGTINIAYDSLGTAMVNDGDVLPLSMRGYTKSFVDYGVAQAYYHHDIYKPEIARLFETAASIGKQEFVKEITPRQRTNSEYVAIVEADVLEENVWVY